MIEAGLAKAGFWQDCLWCKCHEDDALGRHFISLFALYGKPMDNHAEQACNVDQPEDTG